MKILYFFNSLSAIIIPEYPRISEVKHTRRSEPFFTCFSLSLTKMLQLVHSEHCKNIMQI